MVKTFAVCAYQFLQHFHPVWLFKSIPYLGTSETCRISPSIQTGNVHVKQRFWIFPSTFFTKQQKSYGTFISKKQNWFVGRWKSNQRHEKFHRKNNCHWLCFNCKIRFLLKIISKKKEKIGANQKVVENHNHSGESEKIRPAGRSMNLEGQEVIQGL